MQRQSVYRDNSMHGINYVCDQHCKLVSKIMYQNNVELGDFEIWSKFKSRYVIGNLENSKFDDDKMLRQ
jgi:hypothetical protein